MDVVEDTRGMRKEDLLETLLAEMGVQISGCLPLVAYTDFVRVWEVAVVDHFWAPLPISAQCMCHMSQPPKSHFTPTFGVFPWDSPVKHSTCWLYASH
jgi:hypothetical protein